MRVLNMKGGFESLQCSWGAAAPWLWTEIYTQISAVYTNRAATKRSHSDQIFQLQISEKHSSHSFRSGSRLCVQLPVLFNFNSFTSVKGLFQDHVRVTRLLWSTAHLHRWGSLEPGPRSVSLRPHLRWKHCGWLSEIHLGIWVWFLHRLLVAYIFT